MENEYEIQIEIENKCYLDAFIAPHYQCVIQHQIRFRKKN